MGKKILPKYRSTQGELYAVCEIAWASCRAQLNPTAGVSKSFHGFKAYYTDAFIDARLAELAYAENLPDEENRSDEHEAARVALAAKLIECADKWQDLKRYIIEAFAKNLQKTKLEAAGQRYYKRTTGENWEVCELLMRSAGKFIHANLAKLTAGDNMPGGFEFEFNTLKNEFAALFLAFKTIEETVFQETETKIKANNICYDAVEKMMKDGQRIFKYNTALVKSFIFLQVLKLVRGASSVIRTFIIPPSGFKVVKRVVANSRLENIGDTIIFYCKSKAACNQDTDPFVNPGDDVKLNASFETVSITNPNAVAGKVRMRVMIH